MRAELHPHPDTPSGPISRIAVEISRAPRTLTLRYSAEGELDDVLWPRRAPETRASELWKYTCFEAFLRSPDHASYYELNFAPSTQWAAYRFDGYRAGMSQAPLDLLTFDVKRGADRFALDVMFEPRDRPDLPRMATWRIGLSAVIEDTRGAKTYWALRHPPGKPDFHHSDCFALELTSA